MYSDLMADGGGAQLESLLHDWRAGSDEALGALLTACRRFLLLSASRQLDTDLQAKGGASDLVQETLLEAQRDLVHFHGTTQAELLAWLQRILTNNVSNFRRRYRVAKRHVQREKSLDDNRRFERWSQRLPSPSTSPSGRAARREEVEILQASLARLPADYRQVLELRHKGHCAFKEIGCRMGRSPDAVRMLWARALEHLSMELERRHVRD